MNSATIHSPAGTPPRGRHASDDPAKSLNAIKTALRETDGLHEQLDAAHLEIERLKSMDLGLRNALHARNERLAQLGLEAVRLEEALHDLAGQAYRLQVENERLSAENRALRERAERRRGRHRGVA